MQGVLYVFRDNIRIFRTVEVAYSKGSEVSVNPGVQERLLNLLELIVPHLG